MTRCTVLLFLLASGAAAQNISAGLMNRAGCAEGDAACSAGSFRLGIRPNALNATTFPGSDIGAKVNAAFASCGGACEVEIPAGNYTYSTTINIPVAIAGGVTLECDTESTILNYTGSGDAIAAFGTGVAESGIVVKSCGVQGNAATGNANGLHLRALSQASFDNLRIINFPGDGILNEGANSLTFVSPDVEGNFIDIHNVGVVINGIGYSSNAVKVFGGVIGYARQWGVFEDFSQAALAFPNGGNVYDGVVFEANGTNGQTSGNAFLQGCDGCVITNSYLEFFSKDHIPYNVIVGDSSTNGIGGLDSSPQGVKIVNNHLLSDNATTSIFLINGRLPIVDGNSEVGNVTNFIYEGAAVQYTYIGHNISLDATNNLAGPGVASNSPSAGIDATVPTPNGVGFNSLTGDQQDLQIRTRQGGTDNLVGIGSAGNQLYAIDNTGVADFNGVKVDNAGLTLNTALARISTVGGNNLVTGKIVVSGATFGSVTFAAPYNTPPNCQLTPLEDINAASVSGASPRQVTPAMPGKIPKPPPPRTGIVLLNGNPRWWVTTSPTAVTAHLSKPGSASFTYFCVGDAN